MREEIWIDGFNLFYAWPETAPLLRASADIGATLAICLRRLARFLGNYRRRAIVFLDGGLTAGFDNIDGLSVRYAGSGGKADDLMRKHLGGDERRARRVTAVSNDRGLSGSLRMLGVEMMTAKDFLAIIAKKARRSQRAAADIRLSPSEIETWVEIFNAPAGAQTSEIRIASRRRKNHG